jgi:hypothetical protein
MFLVTGGSVSREHGIIPSLQLEQPHTVCVVAILQRYMVRAVTKIKIVSLTVKIAFLINVKC